MIILCGCLKEHPKKDVKRQKNLNQDKAYQFSISGKADSAFKYYNLAKDEFLIQKDSIGIIYCMLSMAIISTDQGDYFGGQEISLAGLSYLNEKNKDHLWFMHSNYNNLGLANYRLKNYSEAIRFYNEALKFATESKDRFLYLNNKAKIYEELKNYNAAINIYSLVIRSIPKETINYARALANLASAKWLQNPAYNAEPELLLALKIDNNEGEKFGQNFCYARLADFFSEKNSATAISYAKKMYAVAKELNSPDDQLEALYKLVKLSSPKETKQYFVQYEKLNDSLQLARARAKNQFALIRYDTLKLQKDNAEKKYQLIRQKAILFSTIIFGFLVTIFLIFWYRKRRRTMLQEKELEVKNTEIKYVKKIHDRVANQVYNVMMEVENSEHLDKTIVADKLENIYKISRDISYEINDVDDKFQFTTQLTKLLNEYSSITTEITILGNEQELWASLNQDVTKEIMIVLQEIMTNMKKHSMATAVHLKFERIDNQIHIIYLDNGIGISGEPIYKNGLTNTGNRIADINGTINFDSTISKGLKIEISFPVI